MTGENRHRSHYLCVCLLSLFLMSDCEGRSGGHGNPSLKYLDGKFGSGGLVLVDFAGGRDAAYSVTSDGKGRYYVTGPAASYPGAPSVPPPNVNATGLDFGLLCLSASGSRCPGFGTGPNCGTVTVDFQNRRPNRSPTDVAASVVVQPEDDKIVIFGQASFGTTGSGNENLTFAFSRHHPDGSLDSAFGVNASTGLFDGSGRATLDADPRGVNDEAFRGLLLRDGRMVATGFSNPGATSGTGAEATFNYGVVQIRPDGTADPTFGGFQSQRPGVTLVDFGPRWDDRPRAIIQHPDGSLIVAGRTRPSFAPLGSFYGSMVRLKADGAVDVTFGVHQRGLYPCTTVPSFGSSKGLTTCPLPGYGGAIYSPLSNPGNTSTILNDVILDPLGHISPLLTRRPGYFASGFTTAWDHGVSKEAAFFTVRVLEDGSVDHRWGHEGYAIFKAPGSGELFISLLDPQRDYLYLIGRTQIQTLNYPLITRLIAHSGKLDTTFGHQGHLLLNLTAHATPISNAFFRGAFLDLSDHQAKHRPLIAVGEGLRSGSTTADFLITKLLV